MHRRYWRKTRLGCKCDATPAILQDVLPGSKNIGNKEMHRSRQVNLSLRRQPNPFRRGDFKRSRCQDGHAAIEIPACRKCHAAMLKIDAYWMTIPSLR